MFNLKEFIVKNIVNGIKNGTWSKEYAAIMAVNYLAKGILAEEDVESIDTQITEWEAQKLAEEEAAKNTPVVIPEVEDEIIEEEIEESVEEIESTEE